MRACLQYAITVDVLATLQSTVRYSSYSSKTGNRKACCNGAPAEEAKYGPWMQVQRRGGRSNYENAGRRQYGPNRERRLEL